MGIRGLETLLLSHYESACPRIKLEMLVKEFRAETGQTDAIAVIDTNILIRQCLEGLDVICGGQFQEYKNNLLGYVKDLTDLGISPVFFFDGAVDIRKMRCWLARKAETHDRIEKIYSLVDEGINTNPIKLEESVLPAGIYECTLLTLKEANFRVFCAEAEGDLEIARYGREQKCFCIMSRDTDFVILKGARYYLSLFYKHFNRSEMSTFLFDQCAIAAKIGLRPLHLPLLASLLHNDYLDGSYLMPLYSKLLGRRCPELRTDEFYRLADLVPALVRLIRAELWEAPDFVTAVLDRTFGGYPPFLLKNLAVKLGLRNQFEMRDRLREQLEGSLAMYEYAGSTGRLTPELQPQPETDLEPDVMEAARARHRSTVFLNSNVLTLLVHKTVTLGPALEDPSIPAERSALSAMQDFRRRIYGLLHIEGPFKEWLVPSRKPDQGKEIEPTLVEAIHPDPAAHPHPGLLALWSHADDADLALDRWRLVAWALAAHRPPRARVDALADVLRSLPTQLAVPAAVVYLLVHSGALRGLALQVETLVRMLTRACLAARRASDARLRQVQVDRYRRLEVHVAALFMRAVTYVSLLNDVVGAPVPLVHVNPVNYFNGKLFHLVFMDEYGLEEFLTESDTALEELIVSTACEEADEIYTEE